MWFRWNNLDQSLALMDEVRRQLERFGSSVDTGRRPLLGGGWTSLRGAWPLANLYDTGSAYVLQAEVPGLTEKDIQITLVNDTLALKGERMVTAPEGYSVHRQERTPVRFSRSFTFQHQLNPEQCSATVKNGVLTITLAKAPDERPRTISVKAA